MKFEEKECTINDICEEVWYNIYADLTYGEYPESDEDWFKLFNDYLNYSWDIEISEKKKYLIIVMQLFNMVKVYRKKRF